MARLQTCPKCRALLESGTKRCPYCETGQGTVLAPSPEEDARRAGTLAKLLLGACVVVYLLSVVLDPERGDREGSSMDPSGAGIVMFGSHSPQYVQECGQVWRLVAANFVHLDLMHLAFNCLALFILLPLAGQTFGVHRTWVIFLATGVFAMTCSDFMGIRGAGASGALCGMIAAVGIYGVRRKGEMGRALSRRMFTWALFILAYGFLMNQFGGPNQQIDNVGHIAGFISGAALGWLASAVRARGGRTDRIWELSAHVCTGVAIAAAVFLTLNVWRTQERREAVLFSSSVERAMSYLDAPIGQDGVARRRPKPLLDDPAGSGDVRDAVNRALRLDKEGAPKNKRATARREAESLWRSWQTRLICTHQMRFSR